MKLGWVPVLPASLVTFAASALVTLNRLVRRNALRASLGYLQRACLGYAPGTRDLIIGTNIRCPEDFPSHNGNIYHVDMLLSQIGPWRPTPSLSGYRTPMEGLWHTAAGAHPVGGLFGWSGAPPPARSCRRRPPPEHATPPVRGHTLGPPRKSRCERASRFRVVRPWVPVLGG